MRRAEAWAKWRAMACASKGIAPNPPVIGLPWRRRGSTGPMSQPLIVVLTAAIPWWQVRLWKARRARWGWCSRMAVTLLLGLSGKSAWAVWTSDSRVLRGSACQPLAGHSVQEHMYAVSRMHVLFHAGHTGMPDDTAKHL